MFVKCDRKFHNHNRNLDACHFIFCLIPSPPLLSPFFSWSQSIFLAFKHKYFLAAVNIPLPSLFLSFLTSALKSKIYGNSVHTYNYGRILIFIKIFKGTWTSYAHDYCFVSNTYSSNVTAPITNGIAGTATKQEIVYYQVSGDLLFRIHIRTFQNNECFLLYVKKTFIHFAIELQARKWWTIKCFDFFKRILLYFCLFNLFSRSRISFDFLDSPWLKIKS